MALVVDAIVGRITTLIEEHGQTVLLGVLAFLGVGVVFKILQRLLSGRGSN